jgi:hypothetical protein
MPGPPPRPVFIPGNKRKQQPTRFHGAFTGGFSAGYFNTVGSKEGWKPSTEARRDQQLDDFMDDQDHEQWGGPTKVRQEYTSTEKPPIKNTASELKAAVHVASSSLDRLFKISHQTVGPRLLGRLGWREGGSAAYVKDDDYEFGRRHANNDDKEQQALLSSKKIRKIQLQQTRVKLPPPKLDQCGLGFEAFQDAPEFQRHHDRRRKLAQERARGGRDVYRTSELTGAGALESNGKPRGGGKSNDNDGDNAAYVSYETMEDFVGSKSVGGFALQEDADDAYDDAPMAAKASDAVRLAGDEYNTEVYEHSSDDDDPHGPQKHKPTAHGRVAASDFGGVLASWANVESSAKAAATTTSTKSGGLTADGKETLSGFQLGGSVQTHSLRYPGPDIPRDFRLQRHQFGDNEHPRVFQTLSRAVQLQIQDEREKTVVQEALASKKIVSTKSHIKRDEGPMAGGRFSGLAEAMKSRFTAGNTNKEDSSGLPPPPVGLHKPQPRDNAADFKPNTTTIQPVETKPTEITIIRTVQPFAPHPLVCKRFSVPVPANASRGETETQGRFKEAAYFENEILAGTGVQPGSKPLSPKPPRAIEPDEENVEDPTGVPRPMMETLKSIFQAESDSSESEDESESSVDDEKKGSPKDEPLATDAAASMNRQDFKDIPPSDSQIIVYAKEKDEGREVRSTRKKKRSWSESSTDLSDDDCADPAESSQMVVHDGKDKKGDRHSRKEHKRRRKNQSQSAASASSDEDSRSKRRRKERRRDRKKDEKKKRKKSSSKRKRQSSP